MERALRIRGLAVLEGLLTIFLLGLVVAAVVNFLPISNLATDRAGHRLQAQALADSSLERLRALPFSKLSPGSTSTQAEVAGIQYRITSEIFVVPGHESSRLKGLRCQVEWAERSVQAQLENEVWVSCVGH